MSDTDLKELAYLRVVADEDVDFVDRKNRSYGGSWKRRGGVGAFMMLARKWDRLENILQTVGKFGGGDKDAPAFDIFAWIDRECSSEKLYSPERGVGTDGTVLAEIRDLRRYLLLVEAEMMARGVVPAPMRPATIVQTHEQLAARASGSPVYQTTMRELSPTFERVIDGGTIHEKGVAPRPAQGAGKDGVMIRVGDDCTWNPPGNDPITEMTLVDVQPGTHRPVVRYRGDNGGQGGIVTDWNKLRRDTTSERRVPRYDDAVRQRTPEDGAQLASVAPHVVGHEYFKEKQVSEEFWKLFWAPLGLMSFKLEPHVVSVAMPKCLQGFYDLVSDVGWVLRASRIPDDARHLYPKLRRELNAVEFDAIPAWQKHLYEWRENEVKHAIKDRERAWTEEY